MQRRGGKPVLYRGELFEKRAREIAAEITHGAFDLRPDFPPREFHELVAGRRQRHQLAAVILAGGSRLDETEIDQLCQGPRRAGLGDAHSFGQLPDRQGAGAVDRGEKRILPGLDDDAELFEDLLRIGLQAFADTPKAAAEAEKSRCADDIFGQDDTPGAKY
jgi:hypothetical protein